VYMPALENKRSVHSKLVEYMIENILSKDCVFLLIDILFNDMKEDYKLIEGSSTSELEDDDEEIEGLQSEFFASGMIKKDGGGGAEESSSEGVGIDLDKYVDLKGVLTVEKVKDIVGEIMSSCPKTYKFEIMEKIIKNMVFKNLKMR
jgi:hypothetical protein